MFVVQPHLDDAVLGIGALMRQESGLLVSVFAGRPERYPPLKDRPHDDTCGFGRDDDVMGVRRREDIAAVESISWSSLYLGHVDAQYLGVMASDQVRPRREADAFQDEMDAIWSGLAVPPEEVWCPAGVAHADHLWVLQQMAGFARIHEIVLRVWLEPGYRSHYPIEAGRVLSVLTDQQEIPVGWDAASWKFYMIRKYRSQLQAISALALVDALDKEIVGTWAE